MSECCCCSAVTIVGVILGLLVLLKIYTRWTVGIYKGKERLDGKTIVVTGASAGIGMESARDFARRGARVVMTCRDMVKGEKVRQEIIQETGNNNLALKRVDFTDLASVRSCANEILKEEARIDVLLNNAGSGEMPNKTTDDGLHFLMQCNHFGPFLFTNILLEKIRKSTPSRIVNVSSLMHKFAMLDLEHLDQSNTNSNVFHYSNSKLANVYFTIDLANKLKGKDIAALKKFSWKGAFSEPPLQGKLISQTTQIEEHDHHCYDCLRGVNPDGLEETEDGVTVNALHPGAIKTEIFRNITSSFRKLLLEIVFAAFGKSVMEGAQTQIFLCVSKDVEHVTGEYFSDCKKENLSAVSKDKKRAAKLWELSEIAVKLQENEIHYK